MKEVYYLWEENNVPLFKKEYGQDIPNLTVYPIESDAAVPCVIVFPGGGYGHLAVDHEGRQICEFLNKNGFAAFMLCYRLAPYHFPCQELDAKRAVRFVRANAAAPAMPLRRLIVRSLIGEHAKMFSAAMKTMNLRISSQVIR